MPVEIEFILDQRVLVYQISDPFEIEELMEAYQKERTLRDSVPHTVHSIVDMSRVAKIPKSWLTAKAGPGFTHPRSGIIILVGLTLGLKRIVQVILRITKYPRLRYFDTRDEAEAFVRDLLVDEQPARVETA
ncbi:MAG: hypothetical protein KJ065_04865 [Anaerolineae bacterium]|nr:hypothetical protein [Anaerolineae bacterium]